MKAEDDRKLNDSAVPDEAEVQDEVLKEVIQEILEEDTKPSKPNLFCSARLIFCIMCFFAIFNSAYVRAAISMALVCMVAPLKEEKHEYFNRKEGEFSWSSALIGHLTSALFYGFIVGPFVAGFLSFKFGGKIILVIGTIGTGATNFLIPEATRITPILFFVIRIFTGFFSSFMLPAYYDLVSRWITPEETQLLVTSVLISIPVASILNFPISGEICLWFGWVWLFYTLGIWMVFLGIVFCFVIFNNPEDCTFISDKELLYLKSRLSKTKKYKIPWKAIMKSLPIYAYIIMHYSLSYVYLTMVFSLPLFMKEAHNFPLETNGLLSATPFLGSFIMRLLISLFYEKLRLKLKLPRNTIRKIFVFFGATLASTFMLLLTFLSDEQKFWVLGCLILSLCSLEMCLTGGYLLSLLDLCPAYVNIVTGVANTIANVAGLISPVLRGFLTPRGLKEEWNHVFYLNIFFLLMSMTFYLIFGQNHLQPWGLGGSSAESL